MKRHIHKWKRTGAASYTCPLQYEEKCECEKTRWVEEKEGIPTVTWNEYKKKMEEDFQKKPSDNLITRCSICDRFLPCPIHDKKPI